MNKATLVLLLLLCGSAHAANQGDRLSASEWTYLPTRNVGEYVVMASWHAGAQAFGTGIKGTEDQEDEAWRRSWIETQLVRLLQCAPDTMQVVSVTPFTTFPDGGKKMGGGILRYVVKCDAP